MRTLIGPPLQRVPPAPAPRRLQRAVRSEGDEERVSLRVHLGAAVRGEGAPQNTPVLGQPGRIALRPQLLAEAVSSLPRR